MTKHIFSKCNIQNIRLKTSKTPDAEYAKKILKDSGSYQNCRIGKVYVNGNLVLKNVRI